MCVPLKEGDLQKDIFKSFLERCSYFRSVAYSKLFSARFSEWSILGTCSILYHLYITTVLLLPRQRNLTFKKLIKINGTARYCETTTHWLPKYRNMLQYSISTDSWQQHTYTQVDQSLLKRWQYLFWSLLERAIKLFSFHPPSLSFFHAWQMLISPTSFQKEWLIWKYSLISLIVPSLFFFSQY